MLTGGKYKIISKDNYITKRYGEGVEMEVFGDWKTLVAGIWANEIPMNWRECDKEYCITYAKRIADGEIPDDGKDYFGIIGGNCEMIHETEIERIHT